MKTNVEMRQKQLKVIKELKKRKRSSKIRKYFWQTENSLQSLKKHWKDQNLSLFGKKFFVNWKKLTIFVKEASKIRGKSAK